MAGWTLVPGRILLSKRRRVKYNFPSAWVFPHIIPLDVCEWVNDGCSRNLSLPNICGIIFRVDAIKTAEQG